MPKWLHRLAFDNNKGGRRNNCKWATEREDLNRPDSLHKEATTRRTCPSVQPAPTFLQRTLLQSGSWTLSEYKRRFLCLTAGRWAVSGLLWAKWVQLTCILPWWRQLAVVTDRVEAIERCRVSLDNRRSRGLFSAARACGLAWRVKKMKKGIQTESSCF